MKKAIGASVIVILALGAFVAYPAIQRHRDLKETLAWIDQTYNPHEGGDNSGQGHGWERDYAPDRGNIDKLNEEFETTFVSDGGCKVTILNETHPVGIYEDMPSKSTNSFNLGDIDPNSISIRTFDPHKGVFNCQDPEAVKDYNLDCTNAEVVFLTRNGMPAIKEDYVRTYTKLTGAEHEQKSTSMQQKSWLVVDDAAYALRLARAWKHAIELCGGKPSKF